jgi:hypothetical protein
MGLQHADMGLRRRSPKKHNLVESECWDVGTVAAGQRSRSAPSANDAGPWIREDAPQIQRERERAAARPLLLSLLSVHVFFFQLEVAELRSSFPIFSRSCILRRNITVGACMPLPLLQLREIALHTPLCSFFTTSHHSHARGM